MRPFDNIFLGRFDSEQEPAYIFEVLRIMINWGSCDVSPFENTRLAKFYWEQEPASDFVSSSFSLIWVPVK